MKNKIILSALAAVLAISQYSCKKPVEGFNESPNATTDAPANLLLTGVQVAYLSFFEGDMARLTGMWTQQFTGSDRQYIGFHDYTGIGANDFSNAWAQAYRGVYGNALILEEKARAVDNKVLIGMSQVMRASTIGTLTSLWEDVPFAEAGRIEDFQTPKFDKQTEIYANVQKLLDSAITNLSSGVGGILPATKDIFYNGSAAKWVRAARSFKARYYMHVKDYNNAFTSAQLGINNQADDMTGPHGTVYPQDVNKYWSFLVRDREGYLTAINSRAFRILNSTDALYRGNAKTDERARSRYYFTSTGLLNTALGAGFGQSTRFPIITFAETKLIEAEAALRKSSPDFAAALAALNAHRQALSASGISAFASLGLKYDPYVAADFAPGGMLNSGGLTDTQALLREVILEKYISLMGQIEAFADLRRTNNAIGLTPISGTQLPQRFYYPQSEINANPNTPKQQQSDLFKKTTVNQ